MVVVEGMMRSSVHKSEGEYAWRTHTCMMWICTHSIQIESYED